MAGFITLKLYDGRNDKHLGLLGLKWYIGDSAVLSLHITLNKLEVLNFRIKSMYTKTLKNFIFTIKRS